MHPEWLVAIRLTMRRDFCDVLESHQSGDVQKEDAMTEGKVNVAIIGLGFGTQFIPIYKRHKQAHMYAICRRSAKEKATRIRHLDPRRRRGRRAGH